MSTSSATVFGEGSASLMSSFSPVGMRVLVVDDSPACLTLIERLLELCDYIVTKCECAVEALATLRANTKGFDIVITDIRMPDMDGFELLRQINMEMDVPVILMSGYDTTEEVMKGISYGACHYMSKPPVLRQVRYIWQHVLLRKNTGLTRSPAVSLSLSSKSTKKKKREGSNRPRMQWSAELHEKFVEVVNQLGDEAVPKKILELMNVEGLTRDNVSSHLQRYRRFLASKNMCITDLLDNNDS